MIDKVVNGQSGGVETDPIYTSEKGEFLTLPSFTAGENITAGDVVETFNDSGTYKIRKVRNRVASSISNLVSNFTPNTVGLVYHETADRVVLIAGNQRNSSFLTTVVFQVSGTTVTAQSAVVQLSQGVSNLIAFYDSSQSKIIVCYNQISGTTGIYLATIDVSGNTATFSTPQQISGTTSSNNLASFIRCGSSYVACNWNSSNVNYNAITLSGTTFTIGSQYQYASVSNNGYNTLHWDSSQSKLFTTYLDTQDSAQQRRRYAVLNVSGTTITQAQAPGDITALSNYTITFSTQFSHIANGKLYVIGDSSRVKTNSLSIYRFAISSNTLTYEDEFRIAVSSMALYMNNTFVDGNSFYMLTSNGRAVNKIDFTSTSFTIDNRLYVDSKSSNSGNNMFLKVGSSFIHLEHTNSRYLIQAFTQLPTTSRFEGIAQETKNTGQLCKIAVSGQLSSIHSNLPQGVQLYLSHDNTITENWTPFKIGKALNLTTLNINYFEDMYL